MAHLNIDAIDSDNTEMDIEIQRADKGADRDVRKDSRPYAAHATGK